MFSRAVGRLGAMTTRLGKLSSIALLTVLLGAFAAGCGRDNGNGGAGTTAATGGERLSGRIQADCSSTVGRTPPRPPSGSATSSPTFRSPSASRAPAAAERFCRGETDLSDASRPIKDEAAGLRAKGIDRRVPHRKRRAHRRRERRQRLGACLTVGQLKRIWGPLEGGKLEGRGRFVPRREALALRPRHRLGHVRLLHRRDRRRRGCEPLRLRGVRERQRHRHRRLRREGRPRLLRALLLRAEPGHAEGARGRRWRRLRRA